MPSARDHGATRAIPEPSRRSLLTGASAALVAGAAIVTQAKGAATDTGADADLIALADQFWRHDAALDAWNAGRITEAEGERHNAAWWNCCRTMTGITPQTDAGRRAKAAVALVALEKVADPSSDAEVLARTALAEIGGRPQTNPAPDPDAELIAVCAEFLAADADMKATDAADYEDEAITEAIDRRWYAALEQLTSMPARTLGGRLAKANAAWVALESTVPPDGLQREEQAALGALADLTGRASA